MEEKIVGAWSWTYIEGVGRMEFTGDHKVREGFPRDDIGGHFWDGRFIYLGSGTWRLEGDVLITEMTNQLLLDRFPRKSSNEPEFETRVQCQRIVQIDDEKMIFDDGSFLDRDHR